MNGEDKDNEDLYNGLDGDNSGYLDVEGEQDGNGYDDLAGGKTDVGGGGYGRIRPKRLVSGGKAKNL